MERRTVTFTIGGKPTEFQIINVHPDGTEFDPADLVIDNSTEAGRRFTRILAGMIEREVNKRALERERAMQAENPTE